MKSLHFLGPFTVSLFLRINTALTNKFVSISMYCQELSGTDWLLLFSDCRFLCEGPDQELHSSVCIVLFSHVWTHCHCKMGRGVFLYLCLALCVGHFIG